MNAFFNYVRKLCITITVVLMAASAQAVHGRIQLGPKSKPLAKKYAFKLLNPHRAKPSSKYDPNKIIKKWSAKNNFSALIFPFGKKYRTKVEKIPKLPKIIRIRNQHLTKNGSWKTLKTSNGPKKYNADQTSVHIKNTTQLINVINKKMQEIKDRTKKRNQGASKQNKLQRPKKARKNNFPTQGRHSNIKRPQN